jgi:hypothetical protein
LKGSGKHAEQTGLQATKSDATELFDTKYSNEEIDFWRQVVG